MVLLLIYFFDSCAKWLMLHDRYFSLNGSPFLPTDSLLCYSSPQPRQDRKTFHSTGEMSQMLPMDRCRRCQRYGEQSNYNFFLSFSESHLLIFCFSYPGERITLVGSFCFYLLPPLRFSFPHPESEFLT